MRAGRAGDMRAAVRRRQSVPPPAPVEAAAPVAGVGDTPPAVLGGAVGAGAVGVQVRACPLWSGSAFRPPGVRTLKYAHVLLSPRRPASSGPLTRSAALEPSTRAVRIRGETPRLSTSMPRKAPLKRPRRRRGGDDEADVRASTWTELVS